MLFQYFYKFQINKLIYVRIPINFNYFIGNYINS